jgi:perosamine synthetase
MRHGDTVTEFEKAFAQLVAARYAVAVTNGTVSLEIALLANGISQGSIIHTTALTMAATTIAILNAGGIPKYEDVDPDTWLMKLPKDAGYCLPVSLYGLGVPWCGSSDIDDAAQTVRLHGHAAFTSYSLQRSKILNTGEGGVLVTDSEELATEAREIASLGYKLGASRSRIDSNAIKSPDTERHHRTRSLNARMNDATARLGLEQLAGAVPLMGGRLDAAQLYDRAIEGCEWITPQRHPLGSSHSYWCYAVALRDKSLWKPFTEAIVRHGGEMPYGAWRLTYQEPAFRHLAGFGFELCSNCSNIGISAQAGDVVRCSNCKTPLSPNAPPCPVAEDLQPRLVQFQTNDLASAERNAKAVRKAIEEIDYFGMAIIRKHAALAESLGISPTELARRTKPADARENAHRPFGLPCS